MNLDDLLDTIELIDCTGTTTHRMTLLLDGRVRVRVGGIDVTVDPSTRTTMPPSFRLGRGEYAHDQVLDIACNLSRRP